MKETESLKLAREYLGKKVKVVIDRPLNTKHPKHGFNYEANYGYIEDVIAPDGEELDAYYLGIKEPIQEKEGICIAIVHRTKDDDDKLVVVPGGTELTDEEIENMTKFQEQWFDHIIVRK